MTDRSSTPRWRLRLDEFGGALGALTRTEAIRRQRPLTEAELGGLVQFFELTTELAWKTLALRLRSDGLVISSMAPLLVIREATRIGWIDEPDQWAAAIERRNVMAHTYDPAAFAALAEDAAAFFLPMLQDLHDRLSSS